MEYAKEEAGKILPGWIIYFSHTVKKKNPHWHQQSYESSSMLIASLHETGILAQAEKKQPQQTKSLCQLQKIFRSRRFSLVTKHTGFL